MGAKKNSVLIVDDDRFNLKNLNTILEQDYTVFMTKNGRSAIEIAMEYAPDLILLDIIMPEMDGFDVLSILKKSERTKNIPVIIITGLENIENEEKGLDLEAADYIHKPFNPKIVKLKVRNQIQIVNQMKELIELYKKLGLAVRDAENANKAKSAFLARMSHEIRTPLNAVLGISEIQMQNISLTQDVREAFIRINNSGDLLLSIINDILDISKIEAGKLELMQEQYHVASMINDTVFLNIIRYENKNITFILNVDENVPSELYGDVLRIKQILNNLLSNAFKYTAAGEVELSLNAETGSDFVVLVFRVRDTGQGMTEDQLGKLFDEYARFNMETNRTTVGTGLGMGITQNLLHMMNGGIQVQSESGKGTLCTVRIPQGNVNAPALGKEAVKKLRQFRTCFESKINKAKIIREPIPFGRILVVDDIDMNLYVTKGMLSPYGLQIDTATSGAQAIEKIKSSQESGTAYDMVLMDHMMPVMDGIEATQKIRELGYGKLPVIALTANAISGMKNKFLENGFNGFISKPIKMQELDAVLKEWISPEKIIKTESVQGVKPDAAAKNDTFLEALYKITEINIEIGLSHLSGNEELYQITLEKFLNKLKPECSNMSAFLVNEEMHNFMISIHAMKSMLSIIGAMALSETARQLEIASSNQDNDYCMQNYGDFMNEILVLHEKLACMFSVMRNGSTFTAQ